MVPPVMTAVLLLADDDALMRGLVATALRAAGYDVVEASSGHEALQSLAGPYELAGVVTDYQMPGATGLDVLTALQAAGGTTPVVLMSGAVDRGLSAEARRMGASDVFAKPFRLAALVASVQSLVPLRRVGRAA
jgi:CheY-like chemotaxis protein